jgi:hypothetical protein
MVVCGPKNSNIGDGRLHTGREPDREVFAVELVNVQVDLGQQDLRKRVYLVSVGF